jgi:hypothetical protein
MARYHFAVFGPERHGDMHGTDLTDDDAAREYAVRIIRDLRHGDAHDWRGWTMEVTQGKRLVWQLPFDPMEPSDRH